MKRPAFQFYPGDWLKDAALRSCSLEARGLWMDMISHMHQAEPYGHLVLNGRPIDEATLGRMVGAAPNKVRRLIEELERSGTCSRREDGALYSRRMVKDEQLRNERAEFGRLGGNPQLVKGKVNPPLNPKPTPSSSSSSSSSEKKPPDGGVDDPKSLIWKTGVAVLVGQGMTEDAARRFLGQFAKQETKLAEVIAHCAANPKADAKAYIVAAINGGAKSEKAAAEAFEEVRQRIRDGKAPGNWAHPQTEVALEAVGGWYAMKGANSRDNDFRRVPFISAFKEAA